MTHLPDPHKGTLIVGDKAAALRIAADMTAAGHATIIVDTDATTPEAVTGLSMRTRAQGRSLVVIAPDASAVPAQALANLANHLAT